MPFLFGGKRASRFERRRKKKRQRKKRSARMRLFVRIALTTLIIGIIALLITGIYKGTRHPSVLIEHIEVRGGETIAHEEVRHRASERMKGTYFFLIPKNFAYLYPEDEIRSAVARIPRISEVTVERSSRKHIEITFDEYMPSALWCASLDASSTDPCMFIDERGYAFTEAPRLTGSVLVRFVTETQDPQVGEHILSSDRLFATSEFIAALERRHEMHISGVTLTEGGDIIYHLRGGGDILTSEDVSVQDAFDTLESVLESGEYDHLSPGAFLYIDLRFGNKVYIKEEKVATSTATSTAEDQSNNEQ